MSHRQPFSGPTVLTIPGLSPFCVFSSQGCYVLEQARQLRRNCLVPFVWRQRRQLDAEVPRVPLARPSKLPPSSQVEAAGRNSVSMHEYCFEAQRYSPQYILQRLVRT